MRRIKIKINKMIYKPTELENILRENSELRATLLTRESELIELQGKINELTEEYNDISSKYNNEVHGQIKCGERVGTLEFENEELNKKIIEIKELINKSGVLAYISLHADNLRRENKEAGKEIWGKETFEIIHKDYKEIEAFLQSPVNNIYSCSRNLFL